MLYDMGVRLVFLKEHHIDTDNFRQALRQCGADKGRRAGVWEKRLSRVIKPGKMRKQKKGYCRNRKKVVYCQLRAIVLQGGLTFHFNRMGVMPMKKGKKKKDRKIRIRISLMELLTFGIFLLALLTFIFTFCK